MRDEPRSPRHKPGRTATAGAGDAAAPARAAEEGDGPVDLRRRHLRLGWWTLALSVALGLGLQALFAWKARFYVDASASSRRLMWTLAYAHGALLALVNVAFAVTSVHLRAARAGRLALASACLVAATLVVPAGFLLGGATAYGGDPGLGVLLVPAGAIGVLAAAGIVAREGGRGRGG
jgi:hypothetical protein